jgi:chaperonin cofactor prefoldin
MAMGVHEEFATKKDLITFKEEIIHEFHIVAEGLTDHMKLLAEGHSGLAQKLDRVETRLDGVETRLDRAESGQLGIVQRIDHMETRFDHMEKENERQHIETRALIKLSFSELDNRLSSLELQVKELQAWRKQVQDRLQI